MNEARFNSIYSGLSAIARKVFDVVPMATAWDARQVLAEIVRRNIAISRDPHVIEGCLRSLVESGIVRRVGTAYRRVEVAAKPIAKKDTPVKEPNEQPRPKSDAPVKSPSLIDPLASLAAEAAQFGHALLDFSKRLDDALLDLEQAAEAEREQVAKVRQVAELLKSL